MYDFEAQDGFRKVAGRWARRLLLAGATTLGLLALMSLGGEGGPEDLYGPCRVTNVVDGDTVDIACSRESARLRLLNIDTPERGELGYWEATQALGGLVNGREIQLAFEIPGQATVDRFGRVLAYLFDDEGRNLNEEMIRLGWTGFYVKYGEGRFARDFDATALEVMHSGKGLWAWRARAVY